eukprot:jgi/Mesvir1/23897/Mv10681-RA.1
MGDYPEESEAIPAGEALNLTWAFGVSANVRGCVADLSTKARHAIGYVAAHTAVIYNRDTNTQMLLQGHCDPITCMAVTSNKKILATADAGADSMLVLWDAEAGQPIHTVSPPHAAGVVDMSFSSDGEYLVTLAAAAEGGQELGVWDIATLQDTPIIRGVVPSNDVQVCIRFNPEDCNEIVTNGKQRVYFWRWQPGGSRMQHSMPQLSARDFKQSIGEFTVSCFVPGTAKAVTGTVDGDIIVWDEWSGRVGGPLDAASWADGAETLMRKAIKILRIHHAPVLLLTAADKYLVSGGQDGYVRFFDGKFRLTAWYEELDAGPIVAASFSKVRPPATEEERERFEVPNFVVATSRSRILALNAAIFEEPHMVASRAGELVVEGFPDTIASMCVHPCSFKFVLLGTNGCLQVWDMNKKRVVVQRTFPKLQGSAVAYSCEGNRIAVGLVGGYLKLLNAEDLEDFQNFRFTAATITMLRFSDDGQHLATADTGLCVGLLSYGHGKAGDKWEFIGKYRTHSAPVASIAFGSHLGDGKIRLFSLGEDSVLVEYDLDRSSLTGGVKLRGSTQVSLSDAVPTALAVLPVIGGDLSLIVADDGYKLHMFTADTREGYQTTLGPTYAGPCTSLQVMKSPTTSLPYLVYGTAEKVVGLLKLPLDGDPTKGMGLIAHPGAISAVGVVHDASLLITCGREDGVVNLWDIQASVLERSAAENAHHKTRYETVLEGGLAGPLFQEIVDYFCYSQIRVHGDGSDVTHDLSNVVPVGEMPNLMRALGYYPSEEDLQHMFKELKLEAAAAGTGVAPTHVTFARFLAMYTNYRPVYGLGKSDIEKAFRDLGASEGELSISTARLMELLHTMGHKMTREEIDNCLGSLLGEGTTQEHIPENIDARFFAEEILGFEGGEEEADQAQ